MKALSEALPWVAFWIALAFVLGLFIWVNHIQYMAGHETSLFGHKTPEEIRLREATVQLLEKETKK
jgi:hypothetical protein